MWTILSSVVGSNEEGRSGQANRFEMTWPLAKCFLVKESPHLDISLHVISNLVVHIIFDLCTFVNLTSMHRLIV